MYTNLCKIIIVLVMCLVLTSCNSYDSYFNATQQETASAVNESTDIPVIEKIYKVFQEVCLFVGDKHDSILPDSVYEYDVTNTNLVP